MVSIVLRYASMLKEFSFVGHGFACETERKVCLLLDWSNVHDTAFSGTRIRIEEIIQNLDKRNFIAVSSCSKLRGCKYGDYR